MQVTAVPATVQAVQPVTEEQDMHANDAFKAKPDLQESHLPAPFVSQLSFGSQLLPHG